MTEKKWLGKWPARCDICAADLQSTGTFFDARTKQGPWGLLCPACFENEGVGIGPGRAQEYDSKTRIKLHG